MPHSIVTHQEPGLVALSVAVAIVAGYLALDLAQRSAGSAGWARRGWITAGGVTLGMGNLVEALHRHARAEDGDAGRL